MIFDYLNFEIVSESMFSGNHFVKFWSVSEKSPRIYVHQTLKVLCVPCIYTWVRITRTICILLRTASLIYFVVSCYLLNSFLYEVTVFSFHPHRAPLKGVHLTRRERKRRKDEERRCRSKKNLKIADRLEILIHL